jgi:Tol biopolymer transport system component
VLPLVVSAGTGQSVTAVAGRLAFPDWSPDGGRLVWQDARDVEGAAAIIRTDPQGGHRKQITPLDGPGDFPNGADLPVFSPDGRWVLYEKRYADMWITDINGTSTRLVLRGARPLDWKG